MRTDLATWARLERLTWQHVLLALAVLIAANFVSVLLRGLLRRIAESASPHRRLSILRVLPTVRLFIGVAALIVIVPIFVEPTFSNAVALVASVSLALAIVETMQPADVLRDGSSPGDRQRHLAALQHEGCSRRARYRNG